MELSTKKEVVEVRETLTPEQLIAARKAEQERQAKLISWSGSREWK